MKKNRQLYYLSDNLDCNKYEVIPLYLNKLVRLGWITIIIKWGHIVVRFPFPPSRRGRDCDS
jgi:hypothetical protein